VKDLLSTFYMKKCCILTLQLYQIDFWQLDPLLRSTAYPILVVTLLRGPLRNRVLYSVFLQVSVDVMDLNFWLWRSQMRQCNSSSYRQVIRLGKP
jgi:hypothetical protein